MIHQQWQQYLQTRSDHAGSPAGLAYLPDLAAVRFQGPDAARFLQGYLTCDTADLEPGSAVPTALCNLKGRVVMNGWCMVDADAGAVDVILHASLVERLGEFLATYLKFSKTRFVDRREDVLVLAGLDLNDDAERGWQLDARRRLFPCDTLARARALWERHDHLTAGAWLASLTADGIPLVSAAVSERFLPQMLNLQTLGAIDFEKGCYLGQEVVARAQHRGEVKRRLTPLTWQGAPPPAPGSEVTDDDGRSLGVVVQSAAAGDGTAGPLLAVLGRELPHVLHQGATRLGPPS